MRNRGQERERLRTGDVTTARDQRPQEDLDRDRSLEAALIALERRADMARVQNTESTASLAAANRSLREATTQIRELSSRLSEIEHSTCWRMTWPLRWALARTPRVRRVLHGGVQIVWWTLTFQLPARLKQRVIARRTAPAPHPVQRPPQADPIGVEAPSPVSEGVAGIFPGGRTMSVVVCVHDACDDVRRCLASVLECSRRPHEIIVIDDGSQQETREFLRTLSGQRRITLIRHDVSRGYSTSANEGIDRSSGEYVVLLNSDTVVTAGWLNAIELTFDRHPRTGIVGPLSNTASWQSVPTVIDGDDWASNPIPTGFSVADVGRFVSERQPSHHRLPFINGFCFAVRRQVFADIGTFDARSFPIGYGEENDFCIRARRHGWDLRIADNCYTWHAQSRSFSDERRKSLQTDAATVLAQLHDVREDVDVPASFCRASLGMQGVREWLHRRFERETLIREVSRRFAGARIAFILPVGNVAGGANVVFQEAEALRRFGIEVSLINVADRRPGILASYPEYRDQWVFVDDIEGIPSAIRTTGPFDAVITTAYMSTFWAPKQDELPRGTRSAYYIQDFEPLFHDATDLGRPYALASYRWDLKQLLLTKTHWNRNLVTAATGRVPHVIGPSVDVDLFQPIDRSRTWPPDDGIRICAMVRPDTERRAPEATYRLLARLARECGTRVQCHTFGCTESDLEPYREKYPGLVVHHGAVPWRQMHNFLSGMDVFIDMSRWQAMGLTLMEAMASGLLVVGPANGGAAEVVTPRQNGFLVDTSDDDSVFAIVEQIILNQHDAMALRRNAVTTAHAFFPEKAAAALAHLVLCDPGRS